MIEEKYLTDINLKCNELRSKVVYTMISEKECNISYLPTKQNSFIGYLKGYYEQFQKISNGMKETEYNQIITDSGDVLCYDVVKKEH